MLDPKSQSKPSLSLSDEERVDQLCDQFEAAHRDGQHPRIEDYLQQVPEVARHRLLGELMALELEWQREAGTPSNIETYCDRFPDHLTVIKAAFEHAGPQHVDLGDVSTTSLRSDHDSDVECKTNGDEMPERIGRYAIEEKLGQGGFAVVYLAHDTDLDRQVALKVPRADRFRGESDIERFLEEARNVASLDHPGIVGVYDVQRDENSVYIVQQYIPGQNLAAFVESCRSSPREIAKMMIRIAEAVGFAHQAGFYHRDLKLANILIDEDRQPHVTDFGLAVHVSRQHEHRGELAGSYPYMAPEQTRGEAHRIDGRTDIWALGVILYELLTHTRPFHGQNLVQLFDEIENRDPRPPRQIDPSVPRELSRICLACLAKRASDRYESTADLIEDLQHWLDATETPAPATTEQPLPSRPKVVPKGLRSFDAGDADFFLDLLPGPRDRDGLPKSIRFWKSCVEETDPDQTFSVGLIYGPSGCGKSSLVRAGLLPRLAEQILPVYVEATASDTEVRLLKTLRRRCPHLPEGAGLVELLSMLRDHGTADGKKVLIVLDQFEQWLHTHTYGQSQLVDALRQCDGGHLQAVVMVRDDFYRGVNRFFQAIEGRLLEGHNQALVDLFDPDHAKKVLTAFGQAYGKLTETELTHQQTAFLDAAVAGLAEKGEVISVRLAVFAEMMKGRPWTQASLCDVGGTEGVGVTFLEETFASRTAPPNYRLHEKGVRAGLQALLPELGTDIKGQMVPYKRLMNAAGYPGRPADFDALLDILNKEVRLITPTEPDEGGDKAGRPLEESVKYYQLSHDYLVPSLRRWLRRKETESYSGRARLRLADRTALWQNKPRSQQLPPWWEYLNILTLTDRRDWTAMQLRMMSTAGRYYATRGAALLVLVALLAWGGREVYARVRSASLVEQLRTAKEDSVLATAEQLRAYLTWARADLEKLVQRKPTTSQEAQEQLHARLPLVATDETQVLPLVESLLTATPKYVGVIRDALSPYKDNVVATLWTEFHVEKGAADRRFRAGMALASYARDAKQWTDEDYRFLVEQLASSNAEHQPIYRPLLAGIATKCLPHLDNIFETGESSEVQRSAANAIYEFAQDDQPRIARLLTLATPKQYEILFPAIKEAPDDTVKAKLAQQTAQLPADDMSSVARVSYGRQRAGAAITLLRLGEREKVLPVFAMTDDPEAMTQFIHRCRERGVRMEELLQLLRLASDQPALYQPVGASARRLTYAHYALLLALGEYALDEIPATDHEQLLSDLADWYANDPSSAVHGAAGWLLRQCGQDDVVQRLDQTPVPYSPDREWFTLAITAKSPRREYASAGPEAGGRSTDSEADSTTADEGPDNGGDAEGSGSDTAGQDSTATSSDEKANGPSEGASDDGGAEEEPDRQPEYKPQTLYFTFIVFQPGEYQIGSVDDEPDRRPNELRHVAKIGRPFAVLDREVTFGELIAFDPRDFAAMMNHAMVQAQPSEAGSTPDWFQSVEFCRWLSEQAGMTETDQCYASPVDLAQDKDGHPESWPVDVRKPGFHLPTETEWEVACRAGMRTTYGQGSDVGLLSHYAWYLENGTKHVHAPGTRRPGLRGLFDMHGNLYEWCHDWYGAYPKKQVDDWTGPDEGSLRVFRGGSWGNDAADCRSSSRGSIAPSHRNNVLGVRLALSPSSQVGQAGGGASEGTSIGRDGSPTDREP